jgi:membrane protease YdiL (CAAX protease family)
MNFFENARTGNNNWLLYVALLISGFLISQAFAILCIGVCIACYAIDHNRMEVRAVFRDFDSFLETTPGYAAGMLIFAAWMGATWFLFKKFHQRERMTLISGERKLRKNYFLWGMLAYGVIMAAWPVFDILSAPDCYTFNFKGLEFFVFLVLAIVLVPFQTGCEELIFRSYMMQGLGLCTRSKGWALVISSILFGLLHCANNEVVEYGFWKAIPIYVMAGLQLGLFAILTDGIEFSWGVHFINNLVGFVLFSNEGGTLSGNALFIFKRDAITAFDYIYPIVTTIIIYFALRKKMGWDIRKAFDNSGLQKTTPPPYMPQMS